MVRAYNGYSEGGLGWYGMVSFSGRETVRRDRLYLLNKKNYRYTYYARVYLKTTQPISHGSMDDPVENLLIKST